jgi:hypothetical protein
MGSRTRLAIVICAGVAIVAAALVAPQTTADQAVSITKAHGSFPGNWKVKSVTLSFDGKRPRLSLGATPECWGFGLPIGGGWCLPYPTWRVYMVGPAEAGSCQEALTYVDARRARVLEAASESGSCGTMPPLA